MSLVNADASAGKESDVQSLRSPPSRERKTKWNWDGDEWNWSWGGGWGPKPTNKPTHPPVWESSWSSGNNPTDWVVNEWDGDAWAGNGWASWDSPKKPTGAPTPSPSPGPTSKACPAVVNNTCLSGDRKSILQSDFGITITNVNATGYDELEDVFVQGFGVAAPLTGNFITIDTLEEFNTLADFPVAGPTYEIPISNFSCIDEVYALAASACDDNPDCTYFTVVERFSTSGGVAVLRFFSADSVTAQMNGAAIQGGPSVPGFSNAPRESRTYTAFIKTGEAEPQDFSEVLCDVAPFTQAALAFTCAAILTGAAADAYAVFLAGCCGGEPYAAICQPTVAVFNAAAGNATFTQDDYCSCGDLVTADFVQYMAPAAQCLVQDQQDFGKCLTCVSNFVAPFGCGIGLPLCEEDDALNFITATPCEGGVQTDDCVCDACGDVCGTQCKAEIQTALSCQFGSPAKVVETADGNFVDSGSCLDSRIVDGARDFSCPSSE